MKMFEKWKKVHYATWITIIIIGSLLNGLIANAMIGKGQEYKEIPCYDKFNHEIKGAVCIQEAREPYTEKEISVHVIIGMIFFTWIGYHFSKPE